MCQHWLHNPFLKETFVYVRKLTLHFWILVLKDKPAADANLMEDVWVEMEV